jgi:cytochrome b561
MHQVSRYHPVLVVLHWVLAALIVAALIVGVWLATTPNEHPWKIEAFMLHMSGGMLIAALTVLRFIVRLRTSKPAPADTAGAIPRRLAQISHYGFDVLVVLMAGTGLTTAIVAGLNRIVFQRSGEPLPTEFGNYPTFVAHAILAAILGGLLLLHVAAALWHQFVVKDHLLSRMTFRPRRDSAARRHEQAAANVAHTAE